MNVIRLVHSRTASEAPLDTACVRHRLAWVSRARALVADSLERSRAGPEWDVFLILPHQTAIRS